MTAYYPKPIDRTPITKEEIIRQLGLGRGKDFRPFTKKEREAREIHPADEDKINAALDDVADAKMCARFGCGL